MAQEEKDPWGAPEPTCFIAMPITTTQEQAEQYGDPGHWTHVMEELFVPAIERAGFTPVRPVSRGSDWIHGVIVKQLSEADMVLVDLSSHNPNVFFELGVRTSIDKPVALVRAAGTKIPFDTSGMNTPEYDPDLRPWSLPKQVEALADHIAAAVETCAGRNPMWRQFGLTIKAEEPSVDASREDAKLELLADSIDQLREELRDATTTQTPHWTTATSAENLLRALDPNARSLRDREDVAARTQVRLADIDDLTARIMSIAATHDLTIDVEWVGPDMVNIIFLNREEMTRSNSFRGQVRSLLKGTRWTVAFNDHRIELPGSDSPPE